jgi:hypothetical protein
VELVQLAGPAEDPRRQHRVEVSIIDDDWARSRVEVLLNDPLTPEQQAKVLQRRPDIR